MTPAVIGRPSTCNSARCRRLMSPTVFFVSATNWCRCRLSAIVNKRLDTVTLVMTKALRDTQTLHAGCSKAEPKNFAPPQTPSRGCRTAKIQSAGDGHYLYLQSQFGEDRCTQFRVIMVTDPQTNKPTNTPTDRTDYNTLCRMQIACTQCNKQKSEACSVACKP